MFWDLSQGQVPLGEPISVPGLHSKYHSIPNRFKVLNNFELIYKSRRLKTSLEATSVISSSQTVMQAIVSLANCTGNFFWHLILFHCLATHAWYAGEKAIQDIEAALQRLRGKLWPIFPRPRLMRTRQLSDVTLERCSTKIHFTASWVSSQRNLQWLFQLVLPWATANNTTKFNVLQ